MSKIQIIEWYDEIIKAVFKIKAESYIFALVFKNRDMKTYLGIPVKEFIEFEKISEYLKTGKIKENYDLFLDLLRQVKPTNNPLLIITKDLNIENQQLIKYKKDSVWLSDFFNFEYPEIIDKASKHENWNLLKI